jgi:type IV secretory pathway VirB10-like protein
MKRFVRACALVPAVVLSVGCESDVKPVGDALAEDSTLALAVMGARPDSLVDVTEVSDSAFAVTEMADVPEDQTPAPRVVAAHPPARSTPPTVTPSARPRASAEQQRVSTRTKSVPERASRVRAVRQTEPRRIASRIRQQRESPAIASRIPTRRESLASAARVVPSRGWLLLPAGADIELEAERQICNSSVGEAFQATVAEDVVVANGVIIPEGAVAYGEVVSGTGIQPVLALDWISFGGRMYEVNTRVTHTDTKRRSRSYCVPDGGRIVAELTAPLRVVLAGSW